MAPNLEKKRAVRQVMLVRQASSRATPHGRSVGIPIAQVSPPSAHAHLPPQLLCTHRPQTPLSEASAAACAHFHCHMTACLAGDRVINGTRDNMRICHMQIPKLTPRSCCPTCAADGGRQS